MGGYIMGWRPCDEPPKPKPPSDPNCPSEPPAPYTPYAPTPYDPEIRTSLSEIYGLEVMRACTYKCMVEPIGGFFKKEILTEMGLGFAETAGLVASRTASVFSGVGAVGGIGILAIKYQSCKLECTISTVVGFR